jgi:hypothetical protein
MNELVGIAAVVLVAWFAAGTIWNVRRGRNAMRWMQAGLPRLGARTTVRWLGSTAVEMVLSDPKPPFTAVTLVIFLEPRDLPWWPLARARGRRDTLIIRGVLKPPAFEFEALESGSWSQREALPRVPRQWSVRAGGIALHSDGAAALDRADALLAQARGTGLAVRRLSVRRAEPQFQLHVPLPDGRRPAGEFFQAVQSLAEGAVG